MDIPNSTVYFRGFPADYEREVLEEEFAHFGEIKKFFIHKSHQYGMVQYAERRCCDAAISELNNKPPFNMYVNMARQQTPDKRDSLEYSTTPPKHGGNSFNSPNSSQSGSSTMLYEEEILYLDSQNRKVEILVDGNGEIYVPLARVQGIRRVVKRIPKGGKEVINVDNSEFVVLNDQKSNPDNDNMSQTSSMSGRTVTIDNKRNSILIERSFTEDQPQYRRSASRNTAQHRNRSKSRSAPNEEQNQPYRRFNNNRRFQQQQPRDSESTPNGYNNNQNWNRDQSFRKSHSQGALRRTNYSNKEECNKKDGNRPETAALSFDTNNEHTKEGKVILKNVAVNKKLIEKSIVLPKEKFTKIYVVYPVNDVIGWVQLHDNVQEFVKNIMAKLQKASKTAPVQKPITGVLCIAKYEDVWYRARVIALKPKLRVLYIDYGNECEVSENDLLELESDELIDIPAQAVCIKLVDGAPHKITAKQSFNVKPLKVENGITAVQVEEGLYGDDEMDKEKPVTCSTPDEKLPVPAQQDGVLTKLHKKLYSEVQVGTTGILERTITLSKHSFVASFLPNCLLGELKKLSEVVTKSDDLFKANVGDLVCAENEEGWNRALILNIEQGKYTVAFIDYGNITDVKEIRAVPESVNDSPQFSCVCDIDNEYCDEIAKINSFNFTIESVSDSGIRIKLIKDKYLCDCNIKAWSPIIPESATKTKIVTTVGSQCTTSSSQGNNQPAARLVGLKLNTNEDIKLEYENNGNLYVRTKQSDDILRRVNKKMNEYSAKAVKLSKKPVPKQLVAAKFENDWYRAVVKSTDETTANILYIDYGDDDIVKISDLKDMPSELYSEPLTLIKVKLHNFVNKQFSDKALRYLEKLAERKQVLKATFNNFENGVTLTTKDGLNVTDELMKLDSDTSNVKLKIPQKLMSNRNEIKQEPLPNVPGPNDPKITEMLIQEIPPGKVQIKLLSLLQLESNTITICLNKPDVLHAIHVELGARITKYAKTVAPQEPYEPTEEEYVIANNEDKWYRAMCIGLDAGEFNLLFVDYGFTSLIPSNKIRRIPAEFVRQQALANFACLEEIPETPSKVIVDRLQTLLEPNSLYDVEVIEKNDSMAGYTISMPSIAKSLRDEGLI